MNCPSMAPALHHQAPPPAMADALSWESFCLGRGGSFQKAEMEASWGQLLPPVGPPCVAEATPGAREQPRAQMGGLGPWPAGLTSVKLKSCYRSTTALALPPTQGPHPPPPTAALWPSGLLGPVPDQTLQHGPSPGSLVLRAQPCPILPPSFPGVLTPHPATL